MIFNIILITLQAKNYSFPHFQFISIIITIIIIIIIIIIASVTFSTLLKI